MFEKFTYSTGQIKRYYQAATRDFFIANKADVAEVSFVFCFSALIKAAIAVCAKNNLRVRARVGHHNALIQKLSDILDDQAIEGVASKMKKKRNRDLYDGGIIISKKEADFYKLFIKNLLKKVDMYLFSEKLL